MVGGSSPPSPREANSLGPYFAPACPVPPLPLRERHRPPSAAVLEKNAEAKLRLCRIARCDPGEGLPHRDCPRGNPSPQPSYALGLALDTGNLDMIQAWDEDSP